jgi:hypothetical protein
MNLGLKRNNLQINSRSNKAVSLRSFSLFRCAAPVGRRQKKPPSSIPQTLRSTIKKSSSEKEQLFFFALLRSQSPHVHFLRSSGLLHPQYSFISFCFVNYASLHSAVLCLSPLIFSAVALSHSHRGLLRYHFALD